MQEQRQTIYTSHEERGGLRPHGGLSGAWRGDQVSIAKSRRRNCLRRLSVSKNLSCHSEEHPKGTCFAARSDVGIRNLLAANSQKSVKIVRFGNRLPRQSADRLAMTGFFDSLERLPTAGAFHVCKIFHHRADRFTAPFSNSTCFFISCAGHSLHKVRLSRRQNK